MPERVPSSYKDLREFIAYLDKRGQLRRVKALVSSDLEISEITDRVSKSRDANFALLFENVRGHSIPVLIISTFLIFTFVSLAGDPTANIRQNPQFSVITYNNLRHKYHLDRAIPVRYWFWVEDAATHKLGTSLVTSQPIWPDIKRTAGPLTRRMQITARPKAYQ